jgi:hypothetical protein
LAIKRKEDARLTENPSRAESGEIIHGLFKKPPGNQTPLQPRHIHEAYRILQQNSNPLHRAGIIRNTVRLI